MRLQFGKDRPSGALSGYRCRGLRSLWSFIAAAALAVTGLAGARASAQPLPNLTPFRPAGWSDNLVVSRSRGTNADSSPIFSSDSLYVDWAVVNNGTAPTAAGFYTELYVDGVFRENWYTDRLLDLNFYTYFEDYSIGSLAEGNHTIRIKTDSTGVITESNETDNEYVKTITVSPGTSACVAGPAALCLNGGRFRVEVAWNVPAQGTGGVGNASSLTADTGYFWFFSGNNIELVVKVVDGRAFNNRFWVFYGALSDVEYTVTVTDTVTGTIRRYFNPSGQLASMADANAFPGDDAGLAAMAPLPERAETIADRVPRKRLARSEGSAGCSTGPTSLCLNNGRFRVEASWRVPADGTGGAANAVGLTSDTGYFWFFSANNVELVVKVVDGRAFNDAYWVFFGALSDVEYTITVTDTQAGSVRTYFNPSGQLGSVADTSAFPQDAPTSGR